MTLTPQVEALEWDILALEAMVVMEDLAEVMEDSAWVMEVSGGVTEAMEGAMEDLVDMEDLEVLGDLNLHLMVLECLLMASEVDMGELAHTAMVVQVLFMGCQDLEVRGDIMLLLQLTVGNLLLMVLKNQLMVLVQGQPMMQLLRLMLLLPTVFLLVMVVSLLLSNSRVVSSSSLELSNNLEPSNSLEESSNSLE